VKGDITWRSFWDEDGVIGDDWGVQGLPTSFVLDHNGVVRARPDSVQEQDEVVESLLRELDKFERGGK
jgi:hypothetical protein